MAMKTNCASIYFVLVLILCHWAESELFTAISHIEPLLETRQRIINDVSEYLSLEEKRLTTLKKRLDLYRVEQDKAKADISEYLGNPIAAFNLIKGLTTDLDYIRNIIQSATEHSKNITMYHEDLKYPTWEDLAGAAQSISRLQDVYQLGAHELAEGMLGSDSSNAMTEEDCFELGRTLYDVGDYKAALSWMTEAREKYKNDSELYQFHDIDIVEQITASVLKLGELKTAYEFAKEVLEMDPKSERVANLTIRCSVLIAEKETKVMLDQLAGKANETKEEPLSDEELEFLSDMENCKPLCRGESNIPRKVEKSLYCQYLTRNDPFLKIAPFKIEYMNLQPQIIVFHDVMSDAEMEFIQEIARPMLERAEVRVNPDVSAASPTRISKLTWIRDDASAMVARVSRRVADMTGLSMATAEDLQVVNYGIGGHNEVHKDFLRPESSTQLVGNRIATVLFYLSDVALGGATVFPKLRVRVVPKKGTAAVWYNLHPSGEGDLATRHASCPVLRGSKWIATKWIHEVGQELLKPCLTK